MDTLFAFLSVILFIGLIVGVVKPSVAKMKSRKMASIIFGGGMIVCLIIFCVLTSSSAPSQTQTNTLTPEQATREAASKKAADEAAAAQKAAEEAAYNSSPAGQLCLKHPTWTKDDCTKLAAGDHTIWIGMSYDMLIYSYGRKPDHTNVSNYGRGNEYQYCWDNFTPSCFYDTNNDGVIDSYN